MKPIRTAVVGCGAISVLHLPAINQLPDVCLTAVCDVDRTRAQAAADRYDCRFYTDYTQMLEQEELDAVHLLTPHYLHVPMAKQAFLKGIHVLSEKPLSISLKEAREAVELARERGVRYGVVFQNRLNAATQQLKRELDSGRLGRVLSVRVIVNWCRQDAYYRQDDWHGTLDKEGGGVVINQAIHSLDLARWLIGRRLLSADASLHNRYHPTVEVEDSADGLLEFEGGVRLLFYATTFNTEDAPIELIVHAERGRAMLIADTLQIRYEDGRELRCGADGVPVSDGAVWTDSERSEHPFEKVQASAENEADVANVFSCGGSETEKTQGAKVYWGHSHDLQIREFYDRVRSGKPFTVEAQDALLTQEMICAIYDSGRSGKKYSVRIRKYLK